MTKQQAQFLVDAAEYCGNEVSLREDYSGRGMYGKTTCGVVCAGISLLMNDVLEYIKENEIEYADIPNFNTFRTDNMACEMIIH